MVCDKFSLWGGASRRLRRPREKMRSKTERLLICYDSRATRMHFCSQYWLLRHMVMYLYLFEFELLRFKVGTVLRRPSEASAPLDRAQRASQDKADRSERVNQASVRERGFVAFLLCTKGISEAKSPAPAGRPWLPRRAITCMRSKMSAASVMRSVLLRFS